MVKKEEKHLLFIVFISLDSLLKKLEELDRTAALYRGLIKYTRWVIIRMIELARIHRSFGDAFATIGAREPQIKASEAFTKFGNAHRQIDRYAATLLETVRPVPKKTYI